MADVFKVLAQLDVPATTLTDTYTVPTASDAAVSSIVVCNRTGSAKTFRVAVAVGGAADDPKQYIAYDESVAANTHVTIDVGMALTGDDVVRVYASATGLAVSVFGMEVT